MSMMMAMRKATWSMVTFVAWVSASYAGPCSDDIARVESEFKRKAEALAAAKHTGPQDSIAAGRQLQPTPRSIAAAEMGLREQVQQKIDAVRHLMDLARAADASGDKGACEQALAQAQRLLGP
jgi:cytochrome c-type biogenesis protein CcmH/NrfG